MTLLRTHHEDLLDALTQRVRVVTCDQAARLLGVDSEEARSILESLERSSLISLEARLIDFAGPAAEPLFSWRAGEHDPDFRICAYQLRNRSVSQQEVLLALPAAKACRQFGGTRVRPRQSEWSHDVRMSDVWLRYRDALADSSDLTWQSGDGIRSDGDARLFCGRVPDACLRNTAGRIVRIIEGGGRGYSRSKLEAMHRDFGAVAAWELW
ncbi:MAG: hypothetical protein CMJ58_25575 [Planctomycetaceae bacterium]|nr:hypothetical protein [Planctomycetaceae bacterium]